jgi:uncharacterized Zn-binding protein involved in type VI secretion
MGTPAAVSGDPINGTCAIHQIPNPASGAPQPGPPMPFSAPLTIGLAAKTFIEKKLAATVGSSGLNTPPHLGLHPADPYLAPPMQQGLVVSGSASVFIEGKQAATSASRATICAGTPGTIVGSAASVMIG